MFKHATKIKMGFIKGDPLVHSISVYRDRHWLLHAYVLPFGVIYATWFHAWLLADFYGYSLEAGLICLSLIFFSQVVLVLACVWSVHVYAWVTCSKVKHPREGATYAKFVPTANNGSAELVRIRRSAKTGDIWVMFQKLKYIWSDVDDHFSGLQFPVNETLGYYLHSPGHKDEDSLSETRRIFGDNK